MVVVVVVVVVVVRVRVVVERGTVVVAGVVVFIQLDAQSLARAAPRRPQAAPMPLSRRFRAALVAFLVPSYIPYAISG